MPVSDELLLTLRQIGADDIADGLENVASSLDDLEKSQEEANQTGEKAVNGDKAHKKSLLEVNAALDLAQKGFNAAKMVVGALGDAVEATVGKYADYSREVQLLSNNLGLSTEETSRLIQVADDYGVSTGEVTSALQMMVRRGVKPSIEELANLADEYRAIEDPVKRAELMTEKLGRGWTTLTPLLKEGGQAIRDSAASQSDALIISAEDVRLTEELRVAKDDLGDAFDGIAMRIGKKVIPAFTGLIDTLGGVLQAADANMVMLDETKTKTDRLAAAEWLLSEAKGFSKPLYQERVDTLKQEVIQLNKENDAIGLVTDAEILAARAKAELEVENTGLISSGDDLVESILAEEAGMKRASTEADRHAAALKTIELANIATAKAAAATTTAFLNQATSLQGASDLSDYAKVALAGIEEQLKTGQISASQYSAAYQTLGIQAGIVTKESLAATRGIELVNAQFKNLSAAEYSAAIAKIPEAAKDGVVTLAEVGIKTTGTLRKSKQDMLDELGNAAKDTVAGVSGAISTNMLKVSSAVGATRSLVSGLKTDLKTLSDTQIMIKYSFVLVGSTPLSGGGTGGGRAYGGAVGAGVPYIIGENGRETFVPQQAGIVVPNNITNSVTNNITTDRMGVALAMARAQQMAAEARM